MKNKQKNSKLSLDKIKIAQINKNHQKNIFGGQSGNGNTDDGSNTTIMTVFPW